MSNKIIYNKIVRDKMIDIWNSDKIKGDVYDNISYKHLDKKDILEGLKDKIHEETKEVMEAYDEEDKIHLKEELGDLIEVIDAILYHNNIPLEEVLKMREEKKKIRGGFEKGLYLEWVDYKDGYKK